MTIRRVPITDTADAVKRVVSERRAGKRSGGGVDMIWINGENFAAGKQSQLWLDGWSTGLPNAEKYVDFDDPAISTDFQVPVDGQESPWQSARFVFAHDSAKVPDPPRDFDALLAYAKAHPGRFTYPAPPDFTGSAFVRQVVAAKGEDEAFAYLKELKPLMYRKGASFPKSQAELDELFANGQVDFAMAYDANFINAGVRKGGFPKSARPFLVGDGALTNTSYVTIPDNAAHQAGAQVVADVLLDPRIQAEKLKPTVLGNPTVLDLDKLGGLKSLFANEGTSDYVLCGLRQARHRGEGRRRGAAREALDARGPAVAGTAASRARLRTAGALAPALLVLALLFGGGIAGAVRTSLVPLDGSASLASWRALFDDPVFGDAVRFSLRVAVAATLLAAVAAVGVALVVRSRGTTVRALVALPVPVPHLLVAVLAVLWLAPGGLADRLFGTALGGSVIRDPQGVGIVLVYVYKETPFLVLLLLAAMGRGLREREEAAAVLGASAWQRLRWVVWPTIRTPLVVGSIIVGAFTLGAFEVPLTVGPNSPPTLAEFAAQATQNDLLAGEGVAAAALLLTAAASIGLAILAVRLGKDQTGG